MQQLFLFLKKNSSFFLFLFLELVALFFLMTRSRYQQARFLNNCSTLQAYINERRAVIHNYFGLRKENDVLAEENIYLRSLLEQNQEEKFSIDSLQQDSSASILFNYQVAKVVSNPMNTSFPFITINKGTKDGIELNDAVISSLGAVGKIVDKNDHYAIVMPLFHPKSKLNVRHSASGYIGNLIWHGNSFETLLVKTITRHAEVNIGDSIVTNQYSKVFPENTMIGTIKEFELDASGDFYEILVTPSTEFRRLSNVYVIHRKDIEQINELEKNIEL